MTASDERAQVQTAFLTDSAASLPENSPLQELARRVEALRGGAAKPGADEEILALARELAGGREPVFPPEKIIQSYRERERASSRWGQAPERTGGGSREAVKAAGDRALNTLSGARQWGRRAGPGGSGAEGRAVAGDGETVAGSSRWSLTPERTSPPQAVILSRKTGLPVVPDIARSDSLFGGCEGPAFSRFDCFGQDARALKTGMSAAGGILYEKRGEIGEAAGSMLPGVGLAMTVRDFVREPGMLNGALIPLSVLPYAGVAASGLRAAGKTVKALGGAAEKEAAIERTAAKAALPKEKAGLGAAAAESEIRQWVADFKTAMRDSYGRARAAAQSGRNAELAISKNGRGVPDVEMARASKFGSQGGEKTCARFSIAACDEMNRGGASIDKIMAEAKDIVRARQQRELARLDEAQRQRRELGSPDFGLPESLYAGRRKEIAELIENPNMNGLSNEEMTEVARRIGLRAENLDRSGLAEEAFNNVLSGRGHPHEFFEQTQALRGQIDERLARGQAVLASISDGRGSHAITILRSGENASGQRLVKAYDSDAGGIITFRWDEFYPVEAFLLH